VPAERSPAARYEGQHQRVRAGDHPIAHVRGGTVKGATRDRVRLVSACQSRHWRWPKFSRSKTRSSPSARTVYSSAMRRKYERRNGEGCLRTSRYIRRRPLRGHAPRRAATEAGQPQNASHNESPHADPASPTAGTRSLNRPEKYATPYMIAARWLSSSCRQSSARAGSRVLRIRENRPVRRSARHLDRRTRDRPARTPRRTCPSRFRPSQGRAGGAAGVTRAETG
jgi:hypothetical protein